MRTIYKCHDCRQSLKQTEISLFFLRKYTNMVAFKDQEAVKCLSSLHDKYVIVPDKYVIC